MNIAIVLAAGKSERLSDISVPKQLYLINKVPLFMYSVLSFNNIDDIDSIYVVTNQDCLEAVKQYISQYNLKKVKDVLLGGTSRQESVYKAIQRLKEDQVKDDDIVLIHDAARPLLSPNIIRNNIEGVKEHNAVTTAIKMTDTVIKGDGELDSFVDRSNLYRAQTPQSFRFNIIKEAHEKAHLSNKNYSDDSALVKEIGYPVYIVEGTASLFKVTTLDDLKLLEMMVL